jgi:hypothetical protein
MPRFCIDRFNRLIIKRGKQTFVPRNSFSLDDHSRLVYWLNEPQAWSRKYQFPSKLVFSGAWRLNSNYDLELKVDKSSCFGLSREKEVLRLSGEIISAEADKLVFELASYDAQGNAQIQLLQLKGSWGADSQSRLTFFVSKKENPDTLTLKGSWLVNENQQITYTYEHSNLARKTVSKVNLAFEGHWQITGNRQLTYIFSRGTDSRFDFRVQLETPNVYPKAGAIKFRLGSGLRQPAGQKNPVFTLYGTWKFSRSLGLEFEMEYGRGEVHALVFAAEVDFSKQNRLLFELKDEVGKPLGISVVFTHRFLKELDASVFVRFQALRRESRIEGGISIPF